MTRSISIIIPAYNEEKRLPAALAQVIAYLRRGDWAFAEILVVDDGSTDGTADVAGRMQTEFPDLRVLRNPGNRGKGYAVRHGMLDCRGEWALFTDADLSAPIAELEKLWQAAAREDAQVAVGSRPRSRADRRAPILVSRKCWPDLQPGYAPGNRVAVSRYAMRLQAV